MITKSVALGALPETDARVAATSFDDAYPGLYRSAYRVAFRLLGVCEEAADLAQESCARAYWHWGKVGGYDHPEAWVARVAGNLAIDLRRRRRTANRHAAQFVALTEPAGELGDLHRATLPIPR